MNENKKEEFLSHEYNLSTFSGRLKYFFRITDWGLILKSNNELEESKSIMNCYK